ncbi:beta-galactosidase [Sphingobacterium griseoflavum]|uniref:beta-galactosidase n=2 Tax=Sphingobacterium griseoflavum TaxID=1474952 RepID=A0ABQ3HXJ7_9SPHI|nr:beta-galactosidase [Sphingobacterium griseoflavum]
MWDFYCTAGRQSGYWTKIPVPSCWEQEGFGTYNYGHDKGKASEEGRYKTSFELPASWKDKRIYIVFDGAMTDTKIEVNGKQAGDIHQGAFYRFKREITDLVSFKKSNQLAVDVSKMSANSSVNSAERDADFWIFGGIYRPVYIEALPKSHIVYSGIDAKADGKISVEVILEQELDKANVQVDIVDIRTGEKMKTFMSAVASPTKRLLADASIETIQPWSSEAPNLYKAVITLMQNGKPLHQITERFGFRTIEVRERDGVYINGKRMRFKGVNRHCFWPTTGRTVSREQSLQDVRLIKEMNMNAVRMSHYPPDKHFLELCDSLGLYVINELCAWQKPPYDTKVGTALVKEMVTRDINHPSIIFWANGNEGGFNLELDPIFGALDIQKRTVIHPFGLFGGINTVHYISYHSGIKNMFNGRDIFMPTELIHGLYDGGHGAGLDDFWNLMRSNPLSAGMFLWDFADQGIVRTDRNNSIDTDRDHGADGIVGPFREKEGSFYTIKEIWSPIHIEKKYITASWDGSFLIENRYDFTNTDACQFAYTFKKFSGLNEEPKSVDGAIASPDIQPGSNGLLQLQRPENWKDYDMLYVTAKDPFGEELFTWSYEISSPAAFVRQILNQDSPNVDQVHLTELDSLFHIKTEKATVSINKSTGLLEAIQTKMGAVPLSNGPLLITDESIECQSVTSFVTDTMVRIEARYGYQRGGTAYRFSWTMKGDGILQLDYDYRPRDRMEMAGVTFSFPEKPVEGATLLANGPYRVYNNRMKGGRIDVWHKLYNDAITGEDWNYPEFKGYYSLFYGMRLHTDVPFEVYSTSEDLNLHLFTPTAQKFYDSQRNYTFPKYPKGDISFMDAIPSVGTKFSDAKEMGPQSQVHTFKTFSGTPNMVNRLYFKFL